MKKLAILIAVMTVAVTAAEPRIALTKHNFSNSTWNDTGSICQPCHTPHDATAGYPRLWSRGDANSGGYIPYDNGGVAGEYQITQTTKMCLSCHDGVTALESFAGNQPGTSTMIQDIATLDNANIGSDLTNDHPVGFVYQNGGYQTDYTINGTGTRATVGTSLRLRTATAATDTDGDGAINTESGEFWMECTTCHNPHGSGTGTVAGGDLTVFKSLLRVESANLCTTCHTK